MMMMITRMLMSTMIAKHVDHDFFEEGLPLVDLDDYDHEDGDHVEHHDKMTMEKVYRRLPQMKTMTPVKNASRGA